MNKNQVCKECGVALPPDAPQGLCPQCLMKAGLNTQAETMVVTAEAATGSPSLEEVARHFPQLEILALLGRGGMGIVYKARQKHLDRVVALKVLAPEISRDRSFAERFAREARALARLNHPNIVSIFDSGETDGLFYFVMEFVDGTNLRQSLQAKQISPREALAIVPVICDALQYAHDMGIVHRDIKPENVLLDKKGRVKIADFGLAKLVSPTTPDVALTQTGLMMGTPKYMAPEQMDRPAEVDHRADIYSLGVVFYEMLTGELPLGRFALPSQRVQVDVRLDEVVLRTLEQKPERRYQHASEVKSEVETIAGVLDKLPLHLRQAMGYEYKSTAKLFGLPLVHVAHGLDPATGKVRVARGFVAIGGRARGVFAFGGEAIGVFAFGGAAIGVFALGGFGIGLCTLSGFAIGLIFASGGLAIGGIALGGLAVGYYALGGLGFGMHANDAVAFRTLGGWSYLKLLTMSWIFIFVICSAVISLAPVWAKRLDAARGPRNG
jgi:tRNA A-37 threonylcarbamoyl transferase component Bud32